MLREEKRDLLINLEECFAGIFFREVLLNFRRKLIRELKCDLDEELRFLDEMIEMNPKNYQVWFHRQKVQNKLNLLKFTTVLKTLKFKKKCMTLFAPNPYYGSYIWLNGYSCFFEQNCCLIVEFLIDFCP